MNETLFQSIFDKLQTVLPSEWKRVAFYAGYTEGSYTMKYYVDNGKDGYTDCFSVGNVKKAQLIQLFMSIDKIISSERKKLDDDHRWSILSMTVSSDGKIKTEFDYADISDNAIAYEQIWKKKFLRDQPKS